METACVHGIVTTLLMLIGAEPGACEKCSDEMDAIIAAEEAAKAEETARFAAIDAERERNTCKRCNGTGFYQNYGSCWSCDGTFLIRRNDNQI